MSEQTAAATACCATLFLSGLAWAGEARLETYATIHSAGLRVTGADGVARAEVKYREKGGKWKPALPLVPTVGNKFIDARGISDMRVVEKDLAPMEKRLIGSIFGLKPDAAYQVAVSLIAQAGSTVGVLTGGFKTRPGAVTYGKGRTLRVGASKRFRTIAGALREARAGDTVLIGPGVYREAIEKCPSGQPGNPITIRGTDGAVIDGEGLERMAGVNPSGVHDLIVENLEVRSFDYGIFVSRCRRVVVQRNFVTRFNSYGIRLKLTKDSLAQLNTIRTSKAKYFLSVMGGRGNVVRYNRTHGTAYDIMTTRNNRDTDIYGNLLVAPKTNDDGVELEGCTCINLRFWDNVVACDSGRRGTVSVTPVLVGPVYVFRNVFLCSPYCIKTVNDGVVNALKQGHELADFGPVFFYHNTFVRPQGMTMFRMPGRLCHARVTLKNNIFLGGALSAATTKATLLDRKSPWFGQLASDHNAWWQEGGAGRSGRSFDEHSLFADPKLVDVNNRDLCLAKNSPCIDRAIALPNINQDHVGRGPDIGCLEYGVEPPRPLRELRLNCGAWEDRVARDGTIWRGEQFIWGNARERWRLLRPAFGRWTIRAGDSPIEGTNSPWLYRTERYGMRQLRFRLAPGTYTVRLHFAETFDGITAPGGRIFDVLLQGREVLRDFDVFKEAGGRNKALVKEFKGVTVRDTLTIGFTQKVNSPEINALEVVPE